MALSKSIACTKSHVSRQTPSQQGCGGEQHLLYGLVGDDIYRSFIQFDLDAATWADVDRIVKAEIVLRMEDDSTHFTVGTKPKVRTTRITSSWSEGNNAENVWDAGDYRWPKFDTVYKDVEYTFTDDATLAIDVTASILKLAPDTVVLDVNGHEGEGLTNYGWMLSMPVSNIANRGIFISRKHGTTSARPTLLLTYEPNNRAPLAPTLTGPATVTTPSASFDGVHNDPDLDELDAKEIVVYPKDGGAHVWRSSSVATPEERASGQFSAPLSPALVSLKSQTDYEWVARTRDTRGLWGPYSARRALRLSSASAPTVTARALGSVKVLANSWFGGTYADADNDALFSYRIQLLDKPSGHALWADGPYLWDTGEVVATAKDISTKAINRQYGGQQLDAGAYTYRVRVTDRSGLQSAWSYATVTLTQDYIPDPGDIDVATLVDRDAPVRIALYNTAGTAGKHGRGTFLGYIDDPVELGASTYLNQGGEVYWTLPNLHPMTPFCEPHRVHYDVEQWWGDRYRPLFSGLITDFDAGPDEVVFYGTDYLGLYQTAVDERYDPNKADKPADGNGGGGSKYVDKNLDYIIKDQLRYHKNLTDSKVGFIEIGTISALAERATIYGTYTEALPFISGLIDSHKQGTGREARMYVRQRASDKKWEVTLADDWGKDRPNIRLEYGGLLNGFRVVGLGDFGTRVLGVGQKRGEYQVKRAVGKSALDEAQWGRIAKTRFWPDIVDDNDLKRRVAEAANQLAKVGKRMGLAIRADALAPFDGWDVGDNLKVDIKRGVVDTSRYGSLGYWTVYGVEFRYYPDGHTDLTLSLLPKKTASAPNPDLLPSIPPKFSPQWQVGYGVPAKYGEPPSRPLLRVSATDDPEAGLHTLPPTTTDPVVAQFYQDLDTGCVYELDETTVDGDYVQTYCPPEGGGEVPPPDTTPNDAPVWLTPPLDLIADTRLADDGTVLSFIRAFWNPLAAGPPNDDFSHFDVLIRPTVTNYPRGWNVAEGADATGTFPPGTYAVMVTGTGRNGGETVGTVVNAEVTGTGHGIVITEMLGLAVEGVTTPFRVYVADVADGEEMWLAATTSLDTVAIAAPPATGGVPAPTSSTALWTALDEVAQSITSDYTHFVNDALRTFYFGLRSVDKAGNVNPTTVTEWHSAISKRDTDPPSGPAGINAGAGNKLVGLGWPPIYEADLARYEVRWVWAPDIVTYEPETNREIREPGEYPLDSDGNLAYEYGYALANVYAIRVSEYGPIKGNVRAIDTSGNASAWSDEFVSASSKIYPAELALDYLWAELSDIITLNADLINSGDIIITPDADSIGSITVQTSAGVDIGHWSAAGWYVVDSHDPTRAIRVLDGVLSVTKAGTPPQKAWEWDEAVWLPAITPDGMSASFITSGSHDGGHNRVPNSAYELVPMSGPKTVILYDSVGEWTATGTPAAGAGSLQSSVNQTTSGTALAQTSYQAS